MTEIKAQCVLRNTVHIIAWDRRRVVQVVKANGMVTSCNQRVFGYGNNAPVKFFKLPILFFDQAPTAKQAALESKQRYKIRHNAYMVFNEFEGCSYHRTLKAALTRALTFRRGYVEIRKENNVGYYRVFDSSYGLCDVRPQLSVPYSPNTIRRFEKRFRELRNHDKS